MTLLTIKLKKNKQNTLNIIKTFTHKTPQSNFNLLTLGITNKKTNITFIDINRLSYELKKGIKITNEINTKIIQNIILKKKLKKIKNN